VVAAAAVVGWAREAAWEAVGGAWEAVWGEVEVGVGGRVGGRGRHIQVELGLTLSLELTAIYRSILYIYKLSLFSSVPV